MRSALRRCRRPTRGLISMTRRLLPPAKMPFRSSRRRRTRRDSVGLAAGGAIALVLGAATFMSLNSSRHAPVPATTTASAQSQNPGLALAPVPGKPVALPPAGMPVPAQPGTAPMPMPMPGMAHGNGLGMAPGMAPGSSPVLVFDGSGPPGGEATAGPNMRPRCGWRADDAGWSGRRSRSGFQSATIIRRARPACRPGDTVVQGTLIPAVLETAIDTDVPGLCPRGRQPGRPLVRRQQGPDPALLAADRRI